MQSACEKKGVNVDSVLDEINQVIAGNSKADVRWDQEPLSALIDHILNTYHRPLDEELPRLEAMARKVVDVHGDKMPKVLPQLLSAYLSLKSDLEQHMGKEEQILFPMIKQGMGAMADSPISVMEDEHEVAGELLRKLRELTGDFVVPADACNTWRALWHGLIALEESLHEHIHLENNVLFPRALNS